MFFAPPIPSRLRAPRPLLAMAAPTTLFLMLISSSNAMISHILLNRLASNPHLRVAPMTLPSLGIGSLATPPSLLPRRQNGEEQKQEQELVKQLQTRRVRTPTQEMEHITLVGGVVNVALALGKTAAGVAARSPAMIADAAHSLADLVSDVVTIASVRMGARAKSVSMPYGYGKYEAVGAALVAVLLSFGTWSVASSSYRALLATTAASTAAAAANAAAASLSNAAGVASGVSASASTAAASAATTTAAAATAMTGCNSALALGAAVGSVVSKEWIARATEKVADKHNSLPLRVNAMHHRSDALSSVVAIAGIGGAMCGNACLDPLSGLVVAGFVGKMAIEVWGEALTALVDAGDDEVVDDVSQCLAKHRWPEHVAAFSGIRAKRMGSRHHVDFYVELNRQGSGDSPRIEKQQLQLGEGAGKKQEEQEAAAAAVGWWESEARSPSSKGLTPLAHAPPSFFALDASSSSSCAAGLFGTLAAKPAAAVEEEEEEEEDDDDEPVSALEVVETTERIRSILMAEITSISEVCIQLK